jgi:hypothetical protein
MIIQSLILSLTLVALTGCAHSTMRGSVAMKVSENTAHVCLGEKEVKPGDRIAFFRNDCKKARGGGRVNDSILSCEKVGVGEGTVLQVLNEHYSVVKGDAGTDLSEGIIAERKH